MEHLLSLDKGSSTIDCQVYVSVTKAGLLWLLTVLNYSIGSVQQYIRYYAFSKNVHTAPFLHSNGI